MHSLYFVGPEIWSHMSEPGRTRLAHERAQYKKQISDRKIASLNAHMQIDQSYTHNDYSWQPPQFTQAATPYINTNASIQNNYDISPLPLQIPLPPPPRIAHNNQPI